MVGASKILTVSYGTFSCTLEGFDEPFSTMKAIAEYFRDLASDDRYFGAVPPTPDAEMLHRIAEREVNRRVEARVSEHGVVLRPEGSSFTPAEPLPAPAIPVQPPMAEAPAPARPAIPESVAAKLARIRAVVNEAPVAAPVVAEVAFEDEAETENFGAPAATDFGFDLDIGEVPGLKTVKADEAPAEVAVVEDLADESFDAVAEELEEAEAEEDLRTLDAVDEADWEAEEEAREVLTAEESDEDDLAVEDEELASEDEAVEDWSADEPEAVEAAAAMADASEEDDAEEDDLEVEAAQPSARIVRISRAVAEEFDDEDEDEDTSFDMSEDTPVEDRTAALMAALSGDKYEDEKFDDEEFEDGETEEAADNDILAQIGAAIGDTGLPDDEEDSLLNEIADITRDARRDAHEGRAILESASEDDGASVERLMEEAKSKLEGPETRRRFSAIAHLKAAVAATVADRKLKTGGDAGVSAVSGGPVDDTEAYRDDLSKAVRPRRPASDSLPLTQRPTMQTRMAPLVLVSEQRVDLTEESRPEAAVVRPRRVSTAVLETKVVEEVEEEEGLPLSPEDVRSFAEFAEHLGATSLSELLEAAAAYTANVEGITHFSRPQILRRIEGLTEDEDYSREDGLRSFGMLLRQGKIQKVRRGQFVLTDASRFKNEARVAQ